MRIKLLSCLLIFLLALPLMAAPPKGKSDRPLSLTIDNMSYIDANRIWMVVTNHGNFGRDLAGIFGNDYGTYFPYTTMEDISNGVNDANLKSPNYATGIWVGAIDSATGQIRVAVSEYSSEYVPGPMAGGTYQDDRPAYHVYKLYRDSLAGNPNADYTNWPVDQGAPVVYDDVRGEWVPDMIGDQMLWAVFNDANPDQHEGVDGGETLPLGIEVKQTVFAFDREGSLGNIIFIRERIFNKGINTLRDCYFSMWCDPDLGTSADDLVGCDTLLGLGYVYNESNDDGQYGEAPPCLGIDFFQGPLLYTGDPADTARMWGQTWPEYTNLGMVSFNKYINGTDPDNFGQTYGFMLGRTKSGDPYVYPATGDTLLYVCSGDPVTGTGDLDVTSADRRWMQTTGPVTFRPGDSTEILVAMIVGQGATNIQSITIVRDLDIFAQLVYESGFNPPKPPARPVVRAAELDGLVTLSWGDTSEVDPGEYEFEGYTVWQGESAAGPWTILKTYDMDNHRTSALVDSLVDPTTQVKMPVIKRAITNSGLAYHYETYTDALESVGLHNASTYYFRVSAFSFSDTLLDGNTVPIGDRFLENSTYITLVPQDPRAGVQFGAQGMETLDIVHTYGGPVPSDGSVEPVVMEPENLTGHTYQVTFRYDTVATYHPEETYCDTTWIDSSGPDTCDASWDTDGDSLIIILCDHRYIDEIDCETDPAYTDTTNTIYWRLTDITADTVLADSVYNQSGDLAYFTFDGILVQVLGPSPTVNDWDWSGANRCITGVNWGGSGFFGGVGVLDEFFVSDLTPADVRTVEVRWVEPGTGQYAYNFRRPGYSYLTYTQQDFEVWDVTPGSPEKQINFSFLEQVWADDNDDTLHTPNDSLWNPWAQLTDTATWDDSLPAYDAQGGREYFQIMASDYSGDGTPDANYAQNGWFNGGADATYDVLFGGWIQHRGDTVHTSPFPGDVWTLIPYYINLPADTFTFTAPVAHTVRAESALDAIKAVPNPFYMLGGYDPAPGNPQIKFHHLPTECTITIYNLGGDLLRTIYKNDASAVASWNLLTENELPVASGIYIYVVDAPGFGQKIGKMAIMVEAEVLRVY